VSGLIIGLLILVVVLQIIQMTFDSRTDSPSEESSPALLEDNPMPSLLKVQPVGEFSTDPKVQGIVERIRQTSLKAPLSYTLHVEGVEVVGATSIGEIQVTAQFQNQSRHSIRTIDSRLQLRNTFGALVYQASREMDFGGPEGFPPQARSFINYLLDNPPEFHQVELAIDRIVFHVEGFE